MLPSTSSIALRQGLVEKSQEALLTSHMSFFSQPSPPPLPPHLTFRTPYSLQNPFPTLISSSRVDGDQIGSSSSSLVHDSVSNPWAWGEEGIKRSTPASRVSKEDLNNSNYKNKNCSTTANNRNIDNNISFNNSLSSIGAKRMKKVMKGRRKVREPRFCFKTMSEVDVLDDGYKWRKYGQKVVKNTQHPRSYYRCTQDNCRVKKRVERLAEDARMVITTYEGRHTHSPPHDDDHENNLQPRSSYIRFFS